MRKIQKEEIREAAEFMAECFRDYPLYKEFFPNEARRTHQLYYFSWYYIFVRQNFTYFTDDGSSLLSLQKPGDRFVRPIRLLLNPAFLFGILRSIPLSSLLKLPGYAALSAREIRRSFRPETDWFIHNFCVRKTARGGGSIFGVLNELDEGEPLFCFTHYDRNARLYRHLGFKTLRENMWHRVTVYTMRRERKQILGKGGAASPTAC